MHAAVTSALLLALTVAPEASNVGALVEGLEALAKKSERSEVLRKEAVAFFEARDLEPTEALIRDYLRVRLVFEATRDGGWWQLRWTITNREPNSDAIWAQWAHQRSGLGKEASASAECDELSALFAFLSRRLGVKDVGLFWPTWNHVVAVWTVRQEGRRYRVVVPTSQIFIGSDASLGTTDFDPSTQRRIYPYTRRDVRLRRRLPKRLVEDMLRIAEAKLETPAAQLQAERNARSRRFGGS